MKIEVWTPPDPKPEVEKVVRLKIVQIDDGVEINAVDANGNWLSHLVVFRPDGLDRVSSVAEDLGFPLDDERRIVLVGEE